MIHSYISLGSNLGEREQYIKSALNELQNHQGIKLLRVAALYETAPWGYLEQNWFLNTVAEIETELTPVELLNLLTGIEANLGRTREKHWGPRTIDLDILLYGQETVNLEELQIPHPRLTERAFVLVPLAELCADMRLPDGQEVSSLKEKISREQEINMVKRLSWH